MIHIKAYAQELITVIKNSLNHSEVNIKVSDWSDLVKFAKTHGMTMCLFNYAESLPANLKPDNDIMMTLKKEASILIFQGLQQKYAVSEMQQAFESNNIYNMALKGAVTKERYSDSFFRSMGDIDILYKAEQSNELKKTMQSLKYSDFREGRKNDTYFRKPCISVEMHREMVSAKSDYYQYYKNIWNKATVKDKCLYTYELSIEDELIFNIVHLAEHFKEGGAGIRFVVDVFVYGSFEMNCQYLESELSKLNLLNFYHNIRALAEFWFGNGKSSELTDKLADYILSGGVFGTEENAAALSVKNGRVSFLIKTSFPIYEDMCSMFPWLKKRKILLPLAWAVRGCRALLYRRKNVIGQLKRAKHGNIEKGTELTELYSECGL